jgi:hypothetical protein
MISMKVIIYDDAYIILIMIVIMITLIYGITSLQCMYGWMHGGMVGEIDGA